jgi:hypothetical protein
MADIPAGCFTIARLTGAARRHAHHPEPTPGQHHAAVTQLADIAKGRADLLAEVAGSEASAHDQDMNQAMDLRAAQLCIGADQDRIPRWAAEGHRRTTAVARGRQPPRLWVAEPASSDSNLSVISP